MTTETDDAPLEVQVPMAFEVRDQATANWVVRKIVQARQYADRVDAWAAAEIRRAKGEEAFLLRRFGAQLEQWTKQQLNPGYGRRSVPLPAGVVGFRHEPPHLHILDQTKLLTWCRCNLPTAIKVIETVNKTPLLEHLTETGECPNGTELIGGGDKFFVK
jgi:hypothetical protein